jgi:hypothetical protein
MAQHRELNKLIEENKSLKAQLKYHKHMFDYAWQLLLSYSPKCLTTYFILPLTPAHMFDYARQLLPSVQPINDARKTSLLKSMYAVSYLNHTFESLESIPQKIYINQYDQYDWHGYKRPNREFPMRELLPYCDTDYKLNNNSDDELDDSELDVIVD